MTEQPRDLAAEVERVATFWGDRPEIKTLLQHIAALSRELEEHREARDKWRKLGQSIPHDEITEIRRLAFADHMLCVADAKRLLAALNLHEEALRWALDEFIVATSDGMFTDGEYNKCVAPPAHLRAVLAKAMEGK